MIVRRICQGCALPIEPQSDELKDAPSEREEQHDEQFNQTKPVMHGRSIVPLVPGRDASRASSIKQFPALKALKKLDEPNQPPA